MTKEIRMIKEPIGGPHLFSSFPRHLIFVI